MNHFNLPSGGTSALGGRASRTKKPKKSDSRLERDDPVLDDPIEDVPSSSPATDTRRGLSDHTFYGMSEFQRVGHSAITEARDVVLRWQTCEDAIAAKQMISSTLAQRNQMIRERESRKTAFKGSMANVLRVVSRLDKHNLMKQAEQGKLQTMFDGLNAFYRLMEERDGLHEKALEEKDRQLGDEKRWRDEAIRERDVARDQAQRSVQQAPAQNTAEMKDLRLSMEDMRNRLNKSEMQAEKTLRETCEKMTAEKTLALEQADHIKELAVAKAKMAVRKEKADMIKEKDQELERLRNENKSLIKTKEFHIKDHADTMASKDRELEKVKIDNETVLAETKESYRKAHTKFKNSQEKSWKNVEKQYADSIAGKEEELQQAQSQYANEIAEKERRLQQIQSESDAASNRIRAQGEADMQSALEEAATKAEQEANAVRDKAVLDAAANETLLADLRTKSNQSKNETRKAQKARDVAENEVRKAQKAKDVAENNHEEVTRELQQATTKHESEMKRLQDTLEDEAIKRMTVVEENSGLTTEVQEAQAQLLTLQAELNKRESTIEQQRLVIQLKNGSIELQTCEIHSYKEEIDSLRQERLQHEANMQNFHYRLTQTKKSTEVALARCDTAVDRASSRLDTFQSNLHSLQIILDRKDKECALYKETNAQQEAALLEQKTRSEREIRSWQVMLCSLAIAQMRIIRDGKSILERKTSVIEAAYRQKLRTDDESRKCNERLTQLECDLATAQPKIAQLIVENDAQSQRIELLQSQVADCDSHRRLYLGGLCQKEFFADFCSFTKAMGDRGIMAPGLENGKEVEFCLCVIETQIPTCLVCVVHRGDDVHMIWFGKVEDCVWFPRKGRIWVRLGPDCPPNTHEIQLIKMDGEDKRWYRRHLRLETIQKQNAVSEEV